MVEKENLEKGAAPGKTHHSIYCAEIVDGSLTKGRYKKGNSLSPMPCETDYIIVGFQPYSSTELTVAIIWNGPKLWPQIYVYGYFVD